jgi:tRNA A22 N-methylase
MGDLAFVRRFLFAWGFSFVSEKIAPERGYYYEIIAAEKGIEIVENPFYLELGPRLLEEGDPHLVPWLKEKVKYSEEILQGLGRSKLHDRGGINFNKSGKSSNSSNNSKCSIGLRWNYYSHRHQILKDVLKDVCSRE